MNTTTIAEYEQDFHDAAQALQEAKTIQKEAEVSRQVATLKDRVFKHEMDGHVEILKFTGEREHDRAVAQYVSCGFYGKEDTGVVGRGRSTERADFLERPNLKWVEIDPTHFDVWWRMAAVAIAAFRDTIKEKIKTI